MNTHRSVLKNHHVVVVGAGMGGLSVAVDLARQGIKITVIDKAPSPGGKMREVKVGGTFIDAGPTVFTMRWVFESLFSDAGSNLTDALSLEKAEVLARHAWRGENAPPTTLDLYADIEASVNAIGDFASAKDAEGYRLFCARSKAIYQTLKDSYIASQRPSPLDLVRRIGFTNLGDLINIAPFRSLWGALGDYFPDPRLRQLFARYATYVGSSPALAPATLMLIAHVEQDGVWTVKGGMRRIADAIQTLGQRHGAEYKFSTNVEEIIVLANTVTGVRIKRHDGTEDVIACDAVVFNGDVSALTLTQDRGGSILGDNVKRTVLPKPTPALDRSLSAITWNMRAPINARQSHSSPHTSYTPHHHNVFFAPNYLDEFSAVFNSRRIASTPTVYVCAQDRPFATENETNAKDERLLVLINAPADGDTHSISTAEIARLTDATFGLIRDCGYQIDNPDEDVVLTTPDKFHDLFPGTGGALYGRANHGAMASFARVGAKTAINGLYLAGGSVHPGPGVPMATLSGRLAAAQLLADLSHTKR